MTSGANGGPLEKIFFKTCRLWFENDCFDERKRFIHIFKRIWSIVEKFSKLVEKNLRGDHQDQRGDHWKKNFFKTCFYDLKMIVLMKENVLSYFETNLKHIRKIFKNWWRKNLRGDLRTKGGTIGKKIFSKHVFMIWKWLFWWKKTFYHILKRIWSIIEKFSKLVQKNLRGDLRTKGGTIGKKVFSNRCFMIWKWLFWWKKTFFHILKQFEAYWKIFKTGRKKI